MATRGLAPCSWVARAGCRERNGPHAATSRSLGMGIRQDLEPGWWGWHALPSWANTVGRVSGREGSGGAQVSL